MESKVLELIYPLVVEGKYDKSRLACFISSPIITLGGFSVFKSINKINELRAFGQDGLILLTDSDKAGTFIRGKLKTILPGCNIINVFSPVCIGKDNRRNHTNKEGILGVESIDSRLLYDLLLPYENRKKKTPFLSRSRAFSDGISGRAFSSELRKRICYALKLPESISANMLIEYINSNLNENDYVNLLSQLTEE